MEIFVLMLCLSEAFAGYGVHKIQFPQALSHEDFRLNVMNKWSDRVLAIQPVGLPEPLQRAAALVITQNDPHSNQFNAMIIEEQQTGKTMVCAAKQRPFKTNNDTAQAENPGHCKLIFFSSQPSKYIWVIRCLHWNGHGNYCPASDAYFYLHKTINFNSKGEAFTDIEAIGYESSMFDEFDMSENFSVCIKDEESEKGMNHG